jgi:hypothetical protein
VQYLTEAMIDVDVAFLKDFGGSQVPNDEELY